MRIRHAHVHPDDIEFRLVKNENYGGPAVSLHGWKLTPVTPAKYKYRFFEQMRTSVRREGFRNPILAYNLPEGLFLSFGCSRLRVAKEEKVLIPAIIMDYTGAFQLDEEVTEDNWQDYFTDIPNWHEFNADGFEYHYSLERNRRSTYDPKGMEWAKADDIDSEFLNVEFHWIGDEKWQ
jgi:hypothetical protein